MLNPKPIYSDSGWRRLLVVFALMLMFVAPATRAVAQTSLQGAERFFAGGVVMERLGRWKEAIEDYQKAIQFRPDYAVAYYGLGNCRYALKMYRNAFAAYQKACSLMPDAPTFHIGLGWAYLKFERLNDARREFQTAINLAPDNLENVLAYESMALMSINSGEWQTCFYNCNKAMEIDPNSAAAYGYRAWGQLALGHGLAAADDSHTYLRLAGWRGLQSVYATLIAHLGYLQAGRPREARAILFFAATRLDNEEWPYPVVQCLLGNLKEDDLQAETRARGQVNRDKMTELKSYIGLDSLLRGDAKQARPFLSWIKKHGNRSFSEYHLVRALRR